MSDHLPDCIYAPRHVDPVKGIEWGGSPCICDRLRACEARLEDEWLNRYNAAEQRGYDAGFRNGVQAARDAVLAYSDETHKHYGDLFGQCREEYGDRCDITSALRVAARRIDALRGES